VLFLLGLASTDFISVLVRLLDGVPPTHGLVGDRILIQIEVVEEGCLLHGEGTVAHDPLVAVGAAVVALFAEEPMAPLVASPCELLGIEPVLDCQSSVPHLPNLAARDVQVTHLRQ